MRVERLKPENVNVLESFIKELEKDLNVNFTYYQMVEFERGIRGGKRIKKKTFYSCMYKTLNLRYELSFIPYTDGTLELWKINVNDRGNGFGTELMNKILDVSDRTGIKIKLVPIDYVDDENFSKNYLNRLKNWYWEMGFEKPKYPSIDPYFTYSPSVKEYKMVG
jgi:hypothetical protein